MNPVPKYVFTGVEQFPGISIVSIMIEICLEGKFQTYTSLLCYEKVFTHIAFWIHFNENIYSQSGFRKKQPLIDIKTMECSSDVYRVLETHHVLSRENEHVKGQTDAEEWGGGK